MALAMVAADHDAMVAVAVARTLVMFLHRPGGQSQFAAPTWGPRAESPRIRALQDSIDAEPEADHRLAALAERAAMSARSVSRQFVVEAGVTPAAYVEQARVDAARRWLEATTATVDVVARRCGFGSAETLRRAFHRRLGTSPDAYRSGFHMIKKDG